MTRSEVVQQDTRTGEYKTLNNPTSADVLEAVGAGYHRHEILGDDTVVMVFHDHSGGHLHHEPPDSELALLAARAGKARVELHDGAAVTTFGPDLDQLAATEGGKP